MLQIVIITFEVCRISKIPNSTAVRTIEKKMEKKFRRSLEKFKRNLREEWCFESFARVGSHVYENGKKIMKNWKMRFFFSKNLKSVSAYGPGQPTAKI